MRLGRMRRGRWFTRLMALVLAFPLTWIGWNQATYNFAVLQPGRIYRSGQMSPGALLRTLREHQVKTVLNLRGPNPRDSWYRDEVATTLAAGATQIDLPLSSCVWMSRIQFRTLVRVLDTCEYPVLFHCAWGSERTGLAAAVATLLSPGSTLADARRQLALRYLYVRLGNGRIMAELLDQYENWLRAEPLRASSRGFSPMGRGRLLARKVEPGGVALRSVSPGDRDARAAAAGARSSRQRGRALDDRAGDNQTVIEETRGAARETRQSMSNTS